MVTASLTTLLLAVVIGLMSLASGIGAFVDPRRWQEAFGELDRSPGLVLAMAILAYAFGAVIVLLHNVWADPLSVAVSLIGWASLAEGVLLLAIPDWYLRLVRRLVTYSRAWAIFAILLGAFLLAGGLTGRADPTII